MLTLTQTAAEVVRTLVDQSPGETGGLRIAANDDGLEGVALELSLVGEPEAADETIEQSGATVYLDPDAAQLLDDKLLDAQVAEDHVTFVLREDGDDDGAFEALDMGDPHARRNGNSPH